MEPDPQFDMDRFLGHWYTIQKSRDASQCITMNFTKKEGKVNEYKVVETIPTSGIVNTLGLRHDHHFSGKIHVNPDTPGIMELSVPLRNLKLTVFETDYDTYAGLIACKKGFAIFTEPWIIIASRTPSLEPKQLEPVYAKLLKYNINPYVFETINHQMCPERGAQGIVAKTASTIFGGVKHVVGGITGLFGSHKHSESTTAAYDPRETGEYEIDIRASRT